MVEWLKLRRIQEMSVEQFINTFDIDDISLIYNRLKKYPIYMNFVEDDEFNETIPETEIQVVILRFMFGGISFKTENVRISQDANVCYIQLIDF